MLISKPHVVNILIVIGGKSTPSCQFQMAQGLQQQKSPLSWAFRIEKAL